METQKTMASIAVAIFMSLMLIYWVVATMPHEHKHAAMDPRGIEIVLVRGAGDTTRFFIPPESRRKVIGPIVSF